MSASPVLADEFAAIFDAHHRELLAHCYRMTGSFADAEEIAQETFLRAWRSLDRFRGDASPRTWLYRIATNACLDFLKNHERRAHPTDSIAEVLERAQWLTPFPDRQDPADIVAGTQTTDLYLTAALLHLAPRQRAAVVARVLLDLDAAHTADLLACTVVAVNSLLQRAHARLRELGADLDTLRDGTGRHEGGATVRAYIDAHKRGDVGAIIDLLTTDVRISMPPEPPCRGRQDAQHFFESLLGAGGPGVWSVVPTWANGAPAVANYLRRRGSQEFRALSIDVLRIEDGAIVAIHCFLGASTFPAFGLDLSAAGPAPARTP